MKVKLNVKEISSAKEEAMAYYLKFMIDDFMFLMEKFNELEEIEDENNELVEIEDEKEK